MAELNVLIPMKCLHCGEGEPAKKKVALRTKNLLPDSSGLDSTEDSGSHAVPLGGITLVRTGQ